MHRSVLAVALLATTALSACAMQEKSGMDASASVQSDAAMPAPAAALPARSCSGTGPSSPAERCSTASLSA